VSGYDDKDIIKDTVEDLTRRIKESTEKLKELRNLQEDLRSKIFVENSFRRYLQYKLDRVKSKSDEPNNPVSNDTAN
jgi:hypothetical protein